MKSLFKPGSTKLNRKGRRLARHLNSAHDGVSLAEALLHEATLKYKAAQKAYLESVRQVQAAHADLQRRREEADRIAKQLNSGGAEQ